MPRGNCVVSLVCVEVLSPCILSPSSCLVKIYLYGGGAGKSAMLQCQQPMTWPSDNGQQPPAWPAHSKATLGGKGTYPHGLPVCGKLASPQMHFTSTGWRSG
ncbi:hypothetical protein E2C01_017867 [Portunus trituberculatus]|uniref:Uncharacterized protein n=1 Tax=Portunus trituberculatus TaxID=210409 RepID=A0A5B7DUZ4_PORTR|nr:hypothetical protein [Portunus trituberculatus]